MQREPRTVLATPVIREFVRRTVELRGPTAAARVLGVSRGTLLGVIADVGATRGSLALLREAYERSDLGREAAAVSRTLDPEVA